MSTRARMAAILAVLLLTTTGCTSDTLRTRITTETATQTATVTQVLTSTQAATPSPTPTLQVSAASDTTQTTQTTQTTVDPLVDTAAQVVRNYDGDTVTVLQGGEARSVRILGISAPELENKGLGIDAQCWGQESKNALETLLPAGQQVTLVIDPAQGDGPEYVDQHDRLLRYIEIRTQEGVTDVGEYQIRSGNATVYEEYPVNRTPFYRGVQDAAESDGAGLWAACPR